MGRIQGLAESGCLTENQLLKSVEGYVFSITIGWRGCIAGEYCLLRDGLTGSAKPLVVVPFATANGAITMEWSQGKYFDTGLFYDEGSTGGEVWATLTFK